MRGSVRWISAMLVASLASGSWGIVRRDDVADSVFLSSASQEPSVGRLELNPGIGDRRSVVLIRDRWILTAGHNFISNTTSLPVILGGQTYTATNWKRHGAYSTSLANGYDFSVAELDRPAKNVAPTTFFSGADPLGQVATFVGYGASGTGTAGQTFNDFQARLGTNLVEALSDLPNVFISDFDSGLEADNSMNASNSSSSSAAQTSMECTFGNGDSGGGVFIGAAGSRQLIGIMSFRGRLDNQTLNTFNLTRYSAIMGYSKLSLGIPWINVACRKPGSISGRLTIPGWTGDLSAETADITFTNPSTKAVLDAQTFNPNVAGWYSVVTTVRGTVDVFISIRGKSLKSVLRGVTISGSSEAIDRNYTLVMGDTDGDNEVTILDYLAVSAAYGFERGSSLFNANADFDGDGLISILDYLTLSASYGQSGAQP